MQLYARFGSAIGEGITNDYDGLGRLTSTLTTMDGVSRTISSQYDIAGNRTRVTHPDGMFFTYEYDVTGRLTAIRENGASLLTGFAYDPQGRPQNRTERHGSGVGYAFDTVGRLTTIADTFVGGTGNVTLGFGYNPASQVTTHSRSNTAYSWTGAAALNRNHTVDGLSQYTFASVAYGYDLNGNLTSDSSSTFAYDTENRLISASGGLTAALRYDPLGRLYEVSGNSGITRFLYDGDALVAEYNSAGSLTARYVHGSDAKADDPLVWYDNGTPRWLHADHQGSIVAVTNGTGGSPAINTYDEYGIPKPVSQGGNTGRFQYQVELAKAAASNPEAYAAAIESISQLLNPSGVTRFAATLFASDDRYMRVLDGVRNSLGRNIDFERQGDREAIGNALIRSARSAGECQETGSRIRKC